MYTIEKLRLNNFKDVRIPSNKDLYSQFGMRDVPHAGSVGKDGEFTEPVNSIGSTLSDLSRGPREFNDMYEAYRADEAKRNEPVNVEPAEPAAPAE